MNLRIHKKLSKRAAPLLSILGDKREQYRADKYGCYFGQGRLYPCDFKHWKRTRARYPFQPDIKYRPKDGKDWIVLRYPDNPLKGTVMVGSTVGYYDPEWEEETAYESLCRLVEDHFTEYPEWGLDFDIDNLPSPTLLRDISTPTLIFAAAMEIIQAKGARV